MKGITGVILCGGKGSRLNELGKIIPKTLLEVNGKSILDYSIEHLYRNNIERIHIAIGHLGDQIREHVGAKYPEGQFVFCDDGDEASMLQRLNSAIPSESGKSLVIYGDTFIDLDVSKLFKQHQKKDKLVTFISGQGTSPWGVLKVDDGIIQKFEEKPKFLYYIGGFLCQNEFREKISASLARLSDAEGFVELMQSLIEKGQVANYLHEGFTTTFNTVLQLKESEKEVKRYLTLGH